jgi:tetratricopeptide (TPR) repeat protein
MSRPRFLALLLALATLVIYLPVAHFNFLVYDDHDYVTGNRMVRDGFTWDGLKWAFTSFDAFNWHPVTWLSHMADCQLFGLNAGAQHLVNILFHSADAALLLLLLWRWTQKLWPAAFVAALFAWHPLHVESVAWVAERKDVLSTCFALLTLLCYTGFVKEKCRRSLWLAVIFFALGLMAKPMLVTLPFVLLLLDLWPLQRFSFNSFRWSLVLEKTPFFLLTIGSCAVTCLAQRAAMDTLEVVPLSYRLENAVVNLMYYLAALFWPVKLAVIYPIAPIPATTFVLAVVVLLFISVAVWWARRFNDCWLVGWLWFLGTLVPVIGLVQVGSASMADRYTYIPSIGIFMAVAFGLSGMTGKLAQLRPWLAGGAALALLACVLLTERQLGYWTDSETLFRHAIAVTQNNDVAHDNLGLALDREGRAAEALVEYRESVRLNPAHRSLHLCIGDMLEKLGQPVPALAEYQLCLQHDPQIPALHAMAARALAAQGKYDEAFQEISAAEKLDAKYALPHIVTAKILLAQGQATNAIAELWTAVRAEPYNPDVLSAAARCLATHPDAAVRDGRNAVVFAMKANEIASEHSAEVFDVLGMAFAETGDFTNAVACAQNAVNLGTEAKLADVPAFQTRLELYQKNQPWREAFALTNAPVGN